MRFLILIFAGLILIFSTSALRAEDLAMGPLLGFTETEKVGFAFYHLLNKDPPFQDWIIARDSYAKSTPRERMDMMSHDKTRLNDGFANYQMDRDLILVDVPLLYTIMENPDHKANDEDPTRELTTRLIIRMPDDKPPYIPFQIGKFWVGVIPKVLGNELQIDMTDEDYKDLVSAVADNAYFKNKKVMTTMILKPLQADAKNPMMEGNLPVFLLMSDVAALYIRGWKKELLWNYTAPWYLNSKARELMMLHN